MVQSSGFFSKLPPHVVQPQPLQTWFIASLYFTDPEVTVIELMRVSNLIHRS
jgi:hypothetical protein